jgi:chromosome condensin MukBEF complex kleisin-like MukF subunit
MSIDILTVTTSDAVRATLGVSELAQELPDAYFASRNIAAALRLELSTWLPATLEELEDAADAADEGDDAILVWDAVQLASTYWCAWEVAKTAPIALFQKLEDGQNSVARPTWDQQELLAVLANSYALYRDKALEVYTDTTPTTATASWLAGVSRPTFDPVTG